MIEMARVVGRWSVRATWLPVVAFFAIAAPDRLEAAAWLVEPGGRLEVGYDDNIRLSPIDEENGIVSSVTGQLTLRQVTERSEVSVVAGATYVDYADVDLDGEDIEFLAFRGRWAGERVNYGVRSSVRRDVLLRTAAILDDFPPGLIDDGGQLLPEDDIDVGATETQIRRWRTRIRPYVDFNLGPRTALGLSYEFYANDYRHASGIDVEDGEQHSLRGELKRSLTERSTGRLALTASRFDPEDSETVDSYEVVAGLDRDFSERFRGSIELGARRAEADDASDTGLVVRLLGRNRFERGELTGRLERSLMPSPFGDMVERDTVTLSYRLAVTDRTKFELNSRAYQVDQSVDEASRDRDYAEVESILERELSSSWSLGFSYRFRWVDRDDQVDSASGNTVTLFLSFRPPSAI